MVQGGVCAPALFGYPEPEGGYHREALVRFDRRPPTAPLALPWPAAIIQLVPFAVRLLCLILSSQRARVVFTVSFGRPPPDSVILCIGATLSHQSCFIWYVR